MSSGAVKIIAIPSVAAAANAAVAGGLDRETTAEVGRVLALLEAALRTRTAVGLE